MMTVWDVGLANIWREDLMGGEILWNLVRDVFSRGFPLERKCLDEPLRKEIANI